MSDRGKLRTILEAACAEAGLPLKALTVLHHKNDPFRIDTPEGRRGGAWLAEHAKKLGLGERTIHLRGFHYALVSVEAVRPDGTPYTNTDPDWEWLQGSAAKAARWLGYIAFDQIHDARNAEPVIRRWADRAPEPWLSTGTEWIEIPDGGFYLPSVEVNDFVGRQPHKLVLFGEKTSLEDALDPLAAECEADLYLAAGEISDTLIHRMAAEGAADGRPMAVLVFADSDPSGWQMAISIARKLQAFKATLFPDLRFQVRRAALTPDQVRKHDLPVSPLKASEKRADKWEQAMGVEQTEIDALIALRPDLLDQFARQAIAPFFDASLAQRVFDARYEWLSAANEKFIEHFGADEIERLHNGADEKLDDLREAIDEINDALHIDLADLDLPEIEIPEPEIKDEPDEPPLIDSDWSWAQQTLRLIRDRKYERDEESS